MKSKGYELYTRPYELNIVGIRNKSTKPNRFDDTIVVFFKDDRGKWNLFQYPATTDTGTYWLENPMNAQGSALLKQGQYKDAYKIGLHRGQYTALVQRKPVTVIRDYNRDAVLDFNNGKEQTGLYGINIHRATPSGSSQYVDKWSAGCQVFQNSEDYDEFIKMADRHKRLYGNSFTYTLIDQRKIYRQAIRYGVYATIFLGLVGTVVYLTLNSKNTTK